jgi:hypothetical protein
MRKPTTLKERERIIRELRNVVMNKLHERELSNYGKGVKDVLYLLIGDGWENYTSIEEILNKCKRVTENEI